MVDAASSFAFAPDPAAGMIADRRMHGVLADSIGHLLAAVPDLPATAGLPETDVAAALDRIRTQRVSAATFASYYDLVPALEGDDFDRAGTLLCDIVTAAPVPPGLLLRGIEDGADGARAALYRAKLDTDPNTEFRFLQPPDPELERARGMLSRAIARFEPALAEGFGELRAMVNEVVFAQGEAGSDYQFESGSSYMLWGAVLINSAVLDDEVSAVMSLLHETAHTLLFGQSIDEPLVLNDDADLFSSPLRRDPRPMDGIFHATFVTARLHHAAVALLRSDRLTPGERSALEATVGDRLAQFHSGLSVVRQHGLLSDTGRAVMDAAEILRELRTGRVTGYRLHCTRSSTHETEYVPEIVQIGGLTTPREKRPSLPS